VAASELIERVAELVERHGRAAPAEVAAAMAGIGQRLREPVRIAIVGRVKAGKSTMVNALLGQRVAPTDVSECTRVVTWFHHGSPQRLVIELDDGSRVERQLAAGGMLPAELGVPLDHVAGVHAYLSNQVLRSMTLIDTPGLGSVHPAYSASTQQLLEASRRSTAAADRADAVVFLMNQQLLEDELGTLASLRDHLDDPLSCTRTLGVLSRADQLGDGGQDPWQVAVELADHYAGILRDQVASVVPVIGLLAETAQTASLTEQDTRALAELARLPEAAITRLTWSADRFVAQEAPVSAEVRQRLLDRLALYGIVRALDLARDPAVGAVAMRRQLAAMSGIEAVRRSLSALFDEQEHVLKVRSALAALTRLAYHRDLDEAGRRSLRNDVEALRMDPLMQPIAEIEAWHAVSSGAVALPDELREDLRILVMPGSPRSKLAAASDDPEVLRAAARAALVRWRTFLNSEGAPPQQGVARVALRSYQHLMAAAG